MLRYVAIGAAILTVIAAVPAPAQQKSVKIGFVSTFSGPTAAIGNDMRNSFELALDHLGRKMGGLPVEVIYENDEIRPDVGRQKTEKLIQSDRVNFVVGYIWSNVLLASLKPVIDSQTFLITANAGPHQIAGSQCAANFFSASWQNDQTPEAMGKYMADQKMDDIYMIAPDYAAGKDMMSGFKRYFKGKVTAEVYTLSLIHI